MKILLVSNMYPSNDDPIFGSFVENIEDGLRTNGADVDKIVIKGRGQNIVDKLKKYFKFYMKILFADLSKYDVVQISYPTHTFLPFLFKTINNTKIISRFHGDDLLHERNLNKILKYFTNKAIEKSSLIIVPSNYFANEFRIRHGENKEIYIYPSGGVDRKKFYPIKLQKDSFNLGYVGRITKQKGVGVLLDAVKDLNIDFKLYIIGDGPDMAYYKKYVYNLNLIDKIIFVGMIKNNELVHYYNLFDLFIFPTMRKAESFGNVAIEAMACKVPIIGSKIAGLNDYIFDNQNGYFFNIGDSNDLRKKIEQYFILDEDSKDKMKLEAYNIAMKYEKNKLNRKFIQKLQQLKGEN